jgi:hypothetical protein
VTYETPPGSPPSLKHLPVETRYVTDAFFWGMGNVLDKGGVTGQLRGGHPGYGRISRALPGDGAGDQV